MKKILLSLFMACWCLGSFAYDVETENNDTTDIKAITPREKVKRRLHRFDRDIQRSVFVPKGSWMGGFQVSYGNHKLDNINMLVLKDVNISNTSFGISPCVGYFFRNNTCAGLRFNFNHNKLDLKNLDLNLGEDFNISLKDLYYIENSYKVSAFMRNYVPLSRSKVFAFFSEVRLTYGHSTGNNQSGKEGTWEGTSATTNSLHVGFAPGMTVFIQDWMALEVQAGVVGFGFNWQNQLTTKSGNDATPEPGSVRSFDGKFKIDLFSISIGTTIYI